MWATIVNDVVTYGPVVVTAAAAASAAIPPGGPGWWIAVQKGINVLAFNFGHATNATKP